MKHWAELTTEGEYLLCLPTYSQRVAVGDGFAAAAA